MKTPSSLVSPGMLVLLALPLCHGGAFPVPAGTFKTRCLERHFWLSVKSSFLGSMVRFDFEDQHGFHVLSAQEAALCGYTVLVGAAGDLVFRASFLSCHARSPTSSDYHLHVWLVNGQADGTAVAYPFRLRCALQGRWSAREVVCEENYMEVSLQGPLPPTESKNDKPGADAAQMALMFRSAGRSSAEVGALSPPEAAALGYHVSQRGPRLTLRCPYSTPFAHFTEVKAVVFEVIAATLLHRLHGDSLAVDATVACPLSEATADGPALLWTIPRVIAPLVGGRSRHGGVRVGVSGDAASEADFKKSGYKIELRDGRVEVRIPAGAPGGHVKSGVLRGRYSQSWWVDLLFTSQWEDQHWPVTQHRSLRLLKTPLVPRTPVLSKSPTEGLFSVTLGHFAPDVSLQKVAVEGGGDLLTWTQSQRTDLNMSRLSHPNGSHSYQLTVPLSHPKIIPEYIGGGHKTYSFSFTFTLSISPSGEVFYHQATMEHTVKYAAPASPRLEGKCTESSLLVLLHHGAQDELQWELFLGARRLDWELAETGGLTVELEDDHLSVEIPLYSPGMNYEELTLRGLVAGVEASVVEAESLKVQDRLVHECTFPVRELLVCLPDGRMVAVVDTTHTVPPTRPDRTSLLDARCVPAETDSARALFSFSVDSCGTTVTTEGGFLVYENKISYPQNFLPLDSPVIHRDSPYGLTIRCRYPANHSSILAIQRPLNSSIPRPLNSPLDFSRG